MMIKDIYIFIYNCYSYMMILNNNGRRAETFIGLTSIIISLVIFIVEQLKHKKNRKLKNSFYLSKTNVKTVVILLFAIYLLLFIEPLFIYNESIIFSIKLSIIYKMGIPNLFYNTVLNFLIIIFLYNSLNTFLIAIKLVSDDAYYNEELRNYILREIDKQNNSYNNLTSDETLNEQELFDKALKNKEYKNTIKITTEVKEKEYIPIFSNKGGILLNYNFENIYNNIKSFEVKANEQSDNIGNSKPLLYLDNLAGKKINKGTIIGYCQKDYTTIEEIVNNSMNFNLDTKKLNEIFNPIMEYIHDLILKYSPIEDRKRENMYFVLNFVEKIFDSKNQLLTDVLIDKLDELSYELRNDYQKTKIFISYLTSFATTAYKHKKIAEYRNIVNTINRSYHFMFISKKYSTKETTYSFINHFFQSKYYETRSGDSTDYYEVILCSLLKYFIDIIKYKEFDSIEVLLDNIFISNYTYRFNHGEYDNRKRKSEYQLVYGMMAAMFAGNNTQNEKTKAIKQWIFDTFIDTKDFNEFIVLYKKLFDEKSIIQSEYYEIDYRDHSLENNWSYTPIDKNGLLLYIYESFEKDFSVSDELYKNRIFKEDKFFFEQIGQTFSKSSNTQLIKIIEEMHNYAITLENEYINNEPTNKEKIINFKNDIIKDFYKTDEFTGFLIENKKIRKVKSKSNYVIGINQMLPREYFINKPTKSFMLSNSYGDSLRYGLESEYIKYLEKIDISKNKMPSNLKNYVVFTNYRNACKLKYDYDLKTCEINNQRIKVVISQYLKKIYIIHKKDIPTVQLCEPGKKIDKDKVEKKVYFNLTDLSKNEIKRMKIIKESKSLYKMGNIKNQNDYLKSQCIIEVCVPFRIKITKDSKKYVIEGDLNVKEKER